MPIKVYVTRNLKFTSGFSQRRSGHAALEVTTPDVNCYISYYGVPEEQLRDYRNIKQENRKKMLGVFRHVQSLDFNNINQLRISYAENPAADGKFINKSDFVEIPALGEIKGAPEIGLNAKRIAEWWTISKSNQRAKFNLISKTMNCASTVMCALWAGGATNYEEYYRFLWVSPRNVWEYAKSLKAKIDAAGNEYANLIDRINLAAANGDLRQQRKLNTTAKKKIASNFNKTTRTEDRDLDECHTTNELGFYDLMSYDDWVRLSYVKASWSTGLATRNEQIAKIDKMLIKYHAIRWNETLERVNKKAGYILEMMKFVRQHMTKKADSRRGDAVLKFGHQLMRTWEEMLSNEKKREAEKQRLEEERLRLEHQERAEQERLAKEERMGQKADPGVVKMFLAKVHIIKNDLSLADAMRKLFEINRQVGKVYAELKEPDIRSLKQFVWGNQDYQPTVEEVSEEALYKFAPNIPYL